MSPLFNPYIQIKQKKNCVLQGVTRQTFARPVTTWSFTVTLPSNRWQIIQKVRWQLNISQNVTLFLEELVFRFKNIQMENTLFDLRDLGVNAGPDCPVITHDWLHTPIHQHNFQSVHGVQQCVGKMDSTEKKRQRKVLLNAVESQILSRAKLTSRAALSRSCHSLSWVDSTSIKKNTQKKPL